MFKKYEAGSQEEIWVGTLKDISGIEFYKEYIAESESRFKKITDALPVMIWASNENDEITYANEEAKKFFRIKDNEVRGIDGLEDFIHPDYKEKIINEWKEKVSKREGMDALLLDDEDAKMVLLIRKMALTITYQALYEIHEANWYGSENH